MPGAALHIGLAFNLICSGMLRTGPVSLALPEENGEPFTITYRIDLDTQRWCSDACDAVEPVVEIFEGQILLRDRHDPGGSEVVTIFPSIRRFTDTRIAGDTATLRSGRCEAAPFSGFPSDLV